MPDDDGVYRPAQAMGWKRWANKTDEERSEHMSMMAKARWKKWREMKAAQRKVRQRKRGVLQGRTSSG